MNLQDSFPALNVGKVQRYSPVEPARAQQRRVQNVRAVGGGQHDDIVVGLEPVHLHQDLVQGLLTLVMSAAQACSPMPPNGVDLIDKHDTRSVPFGLVEQVPYTGRAYADEHLYKFAAADVEEGDTRFPGNGSG